MFTQQHGEMVRCQALPTVQVHVTIYICQLAIQAMSASFAPDMVSGGELPGHFFKWIVFLALRDGVLKPQDTGCQQPTWKVGMCIELAIGEKVDSITCVIRILLTTL